MQLISIGISHRTADIAVRERFALTPRTLPDALEQLIAHPDISELVILSTCNRTEFFARSETADPLLSWFQARSESPEDISGLLEQRNGREAVRHLFSVAAGLDSLVLGEPEILGQTKQAWKTAQELGSLGPLTSQLFEAAFAAAKRIRFETDIGRNPVSVPTVTTQLARQIFGDLRQQQVLFVGAGDMVQACLQHFSALQPAGLHIANRSLKKAQALVGESAAHALTLNELAGTLPEADVVISCTAASEVLIDIDMVRAALRKRRHRPMFIVDLAVPRDVHPEAGKLDDVYLYSIDDLQRVASSNLDERHRAAQRAAELLDAEVGKFQKSWRIHQAGQLISDYRSQAEHTAEHARQEALAELQAGADPREVISRLSHKLARQLLHQPSRNLRRMAAEGDEELLKGLTEMFRVERS